MIRSLIDIQEMSTGFILDKYRQSLMHKIVVKTVLHKNTEEEALQIFLWSLADIEPPINYKEQLIFRALYRMCYSYTSAAIDTNEKALRTLGIPKEKWCSKPKELYKQAKIAYWKQFVAHDLHSFMAHAVDIGLKKKAFMFLSNNQGV